MIYIKHQNYNLTSSYGIPLLSLMLYLILIEEIIFLHIIYYKINMLTLPTNNIHLFLIKESWTKPNLGPIKSFSRVYLLQETTNAKGATTVEQFYADISKPQTLIVAPNADHINPPIESVSTSKKTTAHKTKSHKKTAAKKTKSHHKKTTAHKTKSHKKTAAHKTKSHHKKTAAHKTKSHHKKTAAHKTKSKSHHKKTAAHKTKSKSHHKKTAAHKTKSKSHHKKTAAHKTKSKSHHKKTAAKKTKSHKKTTAHKTKSHKKTAAHKTKSHKKTTAAHKTKSHKKTTAAKKTHSPKTQDTLSVNFVVRELDHKEDLRGKFIIKNGGGMAATNLEMTTKIPTQNTFREFKDAVSAKDCKHLNGMITCKISSLANEASVEWVWRLKGKLQTTSAYVATLKGNNIATTTIHSIIG